MTQEQRLKWINEATLQQLIYLQRFEPAGSRWFTDHVLAKRLAERIAEFRTADPNVYVRTSKSVGWA